jgi:hypothetical protein
LLHTLLEVSHAYHWEAGNCAHIAIHYDHWNLADLGD